MRSFFEDLDKRHRAKEPIQLEPLAAGDGCPGPNCRGHMEWAAGEHAFGTVVLACDGCGWTQERRT